MYISTPKTDIDKTKTFSENNLRASLNKQK